MADANLSADTNTKRLRDLLLIGLAGLILVFPYLGERDLWTSGEARVAQVARQMRTSGDWIVPRLGDNPRLKKPPLAYWLTALASLPWNDVTEFNSRLPNALSFVGVMLIVYLLGCSLHSRNAGLLAAFAIGTTGAVWQEGRTTGIEMPLLLFNMAAFYAWWRYHETSTSENEPARPFGWLILCYGCLGLSFLQKGPVGPLLLLIITLLYLACIGKWKYIVGSFLCGAVYGAGHTLGLGPAAGAPVLIGLLVFCLRQRHMRPFLQHLTGIALLLCISLPWYAAVYWQLPEAWDVWFHESAGRVGGFDHLKEWTYFPLKTLGDGQPWVLIALLAVLLYQYVPAIEKRRLLFPLVWAGVALVFFSIPGSKKSYYILPIYPALALLAAIVLETTATTALQKPQQALRWLLQIVGGILVAAALAAHPLWLYAEHLRVKGVRDFSPVYSAHSSTLILFAILAGLLGLALIVTARRDAYRKAAFAIITTTIIGFGLYTTFTPDRNIQKSDRAICEHLKPVLAPADRVFAFGVSGTPIFTYYLNHDVDRLREEFHLLTQMKKNRGKRTFVLVSESDTRALGCTFLVQARANIANQNDLQTRLKKLHAQLRATLNEKEHITLLPEFHYTWPDKAHAASAEKEPNTALYRCALVVRVKMKISKNLDWRNPEKARAYLDSLLGDLPCAVSPIATLLTPVNHPPVYNESRWMQAATLPFENLPLSNYFGKAMHPTSQ